MAHIVVGVVCLCVHVCVCARRGLKSKQAGPSAAQPD